MNNVVYNVMYAFNFSYVGLVNFIHHLREVSRKEVYGVHESGGQVGLKEFFGPTQKLGLSGCYFFKKKIYIYRQFIAKIEFSIKIIYFKMI